MQQVEVNSKIVAGEKQELALYKRVAICFYFFLTFFEPYLNGALGSFTKYYVFFLLAVLLFDNPKMEIRPYHYCFILWFVYKIISVLWTSNMYIVQLHMVSQIGMILLLVVLTAIRMDEKTIGMIIKTLWLSSALIGILSLLFSQPYHGKVETRQVLVLFGQEADPNNQAAFLVTGISISLYFLLYAKKLRIFSLLILAVNTYSMLLTGSRGGLVTIAVIVVFFVLFNEKKFSIKNFVLKLILIIFLMAALYYIILNYLPEEIYKRLFEFDTYEGGSERDIIWNNTWKLATTGLNFFFGAGWGAYYGYNNIFMVVHNTFLSMFCDVGLLGLSLFFIPIILTSIYLIQKKEILPIILLVCGMVPSFFIEAINKRFFWNAIFILFLAYNLGGAKRRVKNKGRIGNEKKNFDN